MKATITYYGKIRLDYDGTPLFSILTWVCKDRNEFEYAIGNIDKEDIIDIDYFYQD